MISENNILPIAKQTVTASIKHNTRRGYIGWSSCDNICMDVHGCLDMREQSLEAGEHMSALETTAYILASCVKLASHADSSFGMLTETVERSYGLIKKCTKEIAGQDRQARDAAFVSAMKKARRGWKSKLLGRAKAAL